MAEPSVRAGLRVVLCDWRGPEAARLFGTLASLVDAHIGGRLGGEDAERVVAGVVEDLMGGGLAAFRGDGANELVAFVLQRADRAVAACGGAPFSGRRAAATPPTLEALSERGRAGPAPHREATRRVRELLAESAVAAPVAALVR